MTSVRLLVSSRRTGSVVHGCFRDLPQFLAAGDLLVVNTSATLAAALPATRADGAKLELRLSTPVPGRDPDTDWIVELRHGDQPFDAVTTGDQLALPAGATVRIVAAYAAPRLWLARLELQQAVATYLAEYGHPIRYRHVPQRWPVSAYQTVYAAEPGSAEMPSAGRPFTAQLITRLVTSGVLVAPITLHTGVSSQERHEPPYPERFRVPRHTANLVNAVHQWGGRVIAVGTTVVRALETASQPNGNVAPEAGWTNLVVTARARHLDDRRPPHRPSRTRVIAPRDAHGGRRTRADRAQLRRRARARLSLARVRRQPPHPSVTIAHDPPDQGPIAMTRAHLPLPPF